MRTTRIKIKVSFCVSAPPAPPVAMLQCHLSVVVGCLKAVVRAVANIDPRGRERGLRQRKTYFNFDAGGSFLVLLLHMADRCRMFHVRVVLQLACLGRPAFSFLATRHGLARPSKLRHVQCASECVQNRRCCAWPMSSCRRLSRRRCGCHRCSGGERSGKGWRDQGEQGGGAWGGRRVAPRLTYG